MENQDETVNNFFVCIVLTRLISRDKNRAAKRAKMKEHKFDVKNPSRF